MAGDGTFHLEIFAESVRLKSFSKVARKRGLTPSSVARQVTSLEKELGVALFLRSTRSLVLTEAGQLLYERSEQILRDFEEAKRAATSLRQEVRGCVRLTCWPTFAKRCVLPHLSELLERYPALRVDLDLSERLHDPVQGRTDLVIRMGPLADSSLVAVRLGTQISTVAASPAYIAANGAPRTREECAVHRLIDKRHMAMCMGWRSLLGEGRAVIEQMVLQTDDIEAQVQACAAGLGLVFLPRWAIQERLRKKDLVALEVDGLGEHDRAEVKLLRNAGPATAAIEVFSKFLREKVRPSLA